MVRRTHLRKEVRPLDVDGIRRVKVLLRRIGQVLHEQDPRIRDEDVDLAELVDGLFDHFLDIGQVAGVGFDGKGVFAAAELLDQLVCSVGIGRVVDGHFGAAFG